MTLYETEEHQRDIGLGAVSGRLPRINRFRALSVCLFVIAVVYLLQILTPLRLNVDVIHFLSVAASVADGNGYIYYGEPTYYPHGYPAMLAGLDRLGLAGSWSFVGLNCLFIALGMLAAYGIFRRHFCFERWKSLLLICLTLLNYGLVKQLTLPMSDVPFLGASMACVWMLVETERRAGPGRWAFLLFGALLAGMSIWIRTAGIALLPAVLWVAIPDRSRLLPALRRALRSRGRMLLMVGASGVLLAGAIALVALEQPKYFTDLLGFYSGRSPEVLAQIGLAKLRPWGEMLVNVPASRVPSGSRLILALFGALVLFIFGHALWRRRRSIGVVEIYLLAYTGVVLLWPGFDVRFWIPVVPLLVAWAAVAVEPWLHRPFARRLLPLYLAWVFLTGAAALAYSSYLTFSGPRFPNRYGGGSYKPAFQVFYEGGGEAEAVSLKLDRPQREAVFLLIRYEHRTRPPAQKE
ncbi:MAG TPA: hypothetical protein VFG50_01435 [Rhodothermales bacterium]|nr:hypothetical protein [Rhodothermales bacterium]